MNRKYTADVTTRNISGCGLSGMMSLKGERVNGRAIKESIALLHDRSNGLGGGFAGQRRTVFKLREKNPGDHPG